MAQPLTLYKLIVLYMLDKATFPLSNSQISEFILDREYTSYFHLQQALSELVDAKLAKIEVVRNTSYYHLTPFRPKFWNSLRKKDARFRKNRLPRLTTTKSAAMNMPYDAR